MSNVSKVIMTHSEHILTFSCRIFYDVTRIMWVLVALQCADSREAV